jgi:hypothetical protein
MGSLADSGFYIVFGILAIVFPSVYEGRFLIGPVIVGLFLLANAI